MDQQNIPLPDEPGNPDTGINTPVPEQDSCRPVYPQPPVQPSVYPQPVYYAQPAYCPPPVYPPYYYVPAFYQPTPEMMAEANRRAEKKLVRKTGTRAGLGLIFIQIVGGLIPLLYKLFYSLITHSSTSINNIYDYALYYTVFSCCSILLVFLVTAKAGGYQISELMSFKAPKVSVGLATFMTCFLFIAAGNILADVVVNLFPSVQSGFQTISSDSASVSNTFPQLIVDVLYVAAIPALSEEFAMRGVVLGMTRRFGNGFAIFVSAGVFSLMHGNFVQIPFTFIVGIGLGYAVVKSGSMWPAIAAHFANNALSTVLDYLGRVYQADTDKLYMWVFLIGAPVVGLCGVIWLWILARRQKSASAEKTEKVPVYSGCLTNGGKAAAFLSSPAIIVSLVIYLGQALLLALPSFTKLFQSING